MKIKAEEHALRHLAKWPMATRAKALNALEIAALTTAPDKKGVFTLTWPPPSKASRKRPLCMTTKTRITTRFPRSSNPCVAATRTRRCTWLAKMIHAGEDPRFIARRIVICAAEDVGLADPMALVLANTALQVAEFVGWPERGYRWPKRRSNIATANKSNSAYKAIDAALEDVRSGRTLLVPEHLRDTHYQGAERLGHGKGYEYAHDHPGHFVAQDYLGADKHYYEPTEQGVEKKIKERVEKWRAAFTQSKVESPKSKASTS